MARNKHIARKKRLIKENKSSRPAPYWAILKVFGKRRVYRWRLNIHMRRNWRKNKIKR